MSNTGAGVSTTGVGVFNPRVNVSDTRANPQVTTVVLPLVCEKLDPVERCGYTPTQGLDTPTPVLDTGYGQGYQALTV